MVAASSFSRQRREQETAGNKGNTRETNEKGTELAFGKERLSRRDQVSGGGERRHAPSEEQGTKFFGESWIHAVRLFQRRNENFLQRQRFGSQRFRRERFQFFQNLRALAVDDEFEFAPVAAGVHRAFEFKRWRWLRKAGPDFLITFARLIGIEGNDRAASVHDGKFINQTLEF